MLGRYQLAAVMILSLFAATKVANSAVTEPGLHEALVSEPPVQLAQLYSEFTLDGSHHTATTVPELLRRRAFLMGEIRAPSGATGPMEPRLAAIQAEELITLGLATGGIARARAYYSELSEKDRHNLVAHWGRYHCDMPGKSLMRMLLWLPEPEVRALAIAHYVAGLAQRGLLYGSLLR